MFHTKKVISVPIFGSKGERSRSWLAVVSIPIPGGRS